MNSPIQPGGIGMQDSRSLTARGTLLLVIVAVHLFVLVLLMSQAVPIVPKAPVTFQLISFDESPAPAPSRAPSAPPPAAIPQPPTPALPLPQISPADFPSVTAQASTGLQGGGGCALASMIGHSIEADSAGMTALDALPADIRSTTDAVMLWNGVWTTTALTSDVDPLMPLKRIVAQALQTAPAECLDAPNIGPRFIPVADRGRTTMLVIGSGEWKWASLIEADPIPAVTAPANPGGL